MESKSDVRMMTKPATTTSSEMSNYQIATAKDTMINVN